MDWFVRGSAMATAARMGGMNAEKGFEFQKSYAAWLLTKLVTGDETLALIRYEGAQDVDLMLTDGRQVHVQVKKYDRTPLDVAHLADVIKSFAQDYRDAKAANGLAPPDGLAFRLVAVGAVTELAVLDVARRNNLHIHAPTLASKISGKANTPPSLKAEIRAVLERLEAQLFPVGSPADMYRAMAEAGLARFGVIADQIDNAVRALIDGIRWREDISAHDVAALLAPYLPIDHPASGKAAIRLVTGRSQPSQSAEAFYSSQSTIWPAIFADLDAPRDELAVVIDAVVNPTMSKILISGPSGAGKSTLARRAAWDLARRGRALVLEATEPADAPECWGEVVKLAKQQAHSGRFTILVVDDLSDFEQLMSLAADLPFDSPLTVVGTTWRAGATAQRLGEGVTEVAIGRISDGEAKAIAARLSCSLDQISPQQLERILESGQLLLLNLVLLGEGSAESFAARLLERLRIAAKDLVEPYLDLCVFGQSDTSVPTSLLLRHNRTASRLLKARETSGLVFSVGPSRLRSGHRLLSSAAVAAAGVEPVERMLAIASAADMTFETERRFVIRAIVTAVSDEGIEAARASSKIIADLALEAARVGNYLDVRRLSQALARLGMEHQAAETGALATEDRIRSGADAAAYRSDHEHAEPQRTFEVLLSFYAGNETLWGWRNFLRFASKRDENHLKGLALDQARARLSRPDLEPGDGKVIVDLLTTTERPPDFAETLLLEILERFPNHMLIARAVAQCVISRIRSAIVFDALLNYSLPLITTISGEGVYLVKNLTRASTYGWTGDRLRWLGQMMSSCESERDADVRGILLHCSAEIADARHFDAMLDLIGPKMGIEHPDVGRARHIITRKITRKQSSKTPS